jgi:hypothetical protein
VVAEEAADPEVEAHIRRREAEVHIRHPVAEVHIRHPVAALRLVRSTDLHIRNLKLRPAAPPSGDHRSTNIRRPATNSRIVRNDIRRDANGRLPKPDVRVHPTAFCREQNEGPCQRVPPELPGRPGALAQPLGGRVPLEDDQQLPALLAAPLALLGVVGWFVLAPLPKAQLQQKSTPTMRK